MGHTPTATEEELDTVSLPASGHYVAKLQTHAGEEVEHEEGWFDVETDGLLSVRATTEDGRPLFETTVQVRGDRWRRPARNRDEPRAWRHDEDTRPEPLPDADLRRLVAVMGEVISEAMGFTGPASAAVPIRLVVRDGVLDGWSVEMGELVAVARELGHRPAAWLTDRPMTYTVEIDRPGLPVSITPPDDRPVVHDVRVKFRHELSYDAPPDRVYAMLADPEFRRQSCEAMEVISADVQLEAGDGEGFTLTIDQLQNTKDLPSFARTFAGDSTQAIQREVWKGTTTGSLSFDSPGKPTSAAGTITLMPSGAGTTEVVELEIKVKVPLIGGRLEKLVAERVAAGMDVEHTVGVTWLEEH